MVCQRVQSVWSPGTRIWMRGSNVVHLLQSIVELLEELVNQRRYRLDDLVNLLCCDVIGWCDDDMITKPACINPGTRTPGPCVEIDFVVS